MVGLVIILFPCPTQRGTIHDLSPANIFFFTNRGLLCFIVGQTGPFPASSPVVALVVSNIGVVCGLLHGNVLVN